MIFTALLAKARKGEYTPPDTLLSIDPGETLGYAVFRKGRLDDWGQLDLVQGDKSKIEWKWLAELLEETQADEIVCENYRVYQHKLSTHANSEILTVRIIGAIDYDTEMRNLRLGEGEQIRLKYQMASMAKGFCTDQKLKDWGYWKEGMKHSRDAIRHGCYYMLFDKRR